MHINRVVLTGNLTSDPKVIQTASGFTICTLRVASNTRRKDSASGEWVDKPNFFDVKVLGKQGENAAKFLSKGRPVAVDGKLEWREWEDKETGAKRSAVEIVADSIQFLGSNNGGENNGGHNGNASQAEEAYAPATGGDDDLPF